SSRSMIHLLEEIVPPLEVNHERELLTSQHLPATFAKCCLLGNARVRSSASRSAGDLADVRLVYRGIGSRASKTCVPKLSTFCKGGCKFLCHKEYPAGSACRAEISAL